jgi:Fe-S-cluster containining protein
MEQVTKDKSYFSSVCVQKCGGVCCDPWWGIISYPVVKQGGLASLSSFRAEVLKGIRARAQRIIEAYITSERPARPLFRSPEKYNVLVRDIRVSGSTITMNLVAMFAFRCAFVSADRSCAIHPLITGREIRPPHCGFLGTPEAGPGEKGYCRIIHAALTGEAVEIEKALAIEQQTASKNLGEGVGTAEEAADRVVEAVKAWCEKYSPMLLPRERPGAPIGRNDPCWCGSGEKFKKCHGK